MSGVCLYIIPVDIKCRKRGAIMLWRDRGEQKAEDAASHNH